VTTTTQVELGIRVPLTGSQTIQTGRLHRVDVHPVARFITESEIELGCSDALIRGQTIPADGFRRIFLGTFAAVGSESTASSIGSHHPRVANDVS
jgi:hypothetical protein